MSEATEKILILHDDYHAKHIGRTYDGRQFFLSSAFELAIRVKPGREFVVLFLFDDDGRLIEDRIDELGTRAGLGLEGRVPPGNKAPAIGPIEEAINRRLGEL